MVTIVNGAARVSNEDFVGSLVSDILDDMAVSEILSLNSSLSFTVTDPAGEIVSENNDNYVLRNGDTLRFTRTSGTKG